LKVLLVFFAMVQKILQIVDLKFMAILLKPEVHPKSHLSQFINKLRRTPLYNPFKSDSGYDYIKDGMTNRNPFPNRDMVRITAHGAVWF